jgi:hypothetical protein
MAKTSKKLSTVKAMKNDIVTHNGQEWKVMSREFDPTCSQSYYLLKTGKYRSAVSKWARSDTFSVKA